MSAQLKPVEYKLEIYEPGSADDVWGYFESNQPFMALQAGDHLNPVFLPGSESPAKIARVVNIEPHLGYRDHITHKILVFTEEVPGARESRLERKS